MRAIQKDFDFWAVLTFIMIGFVLRFYNTNWDSGLNFHPDERNIDAAVSRIDLFDNLDPEFFAYGGLPVYLYRGIAESVSTFTGDATWLTDWGKINIIGRSFSAIFSTLTIVAVYVLGTKVFDRRAGFLASVFVTFSPGLIQVAHFGITENLLTLLVVVICIQSLNLLKYNRLKNYLLTGCLFGISLSAKTSGISFAVAPLVAIILKTFQKPIRLRNFLRSFLYGLGFLTVAAALFVLLSPYTIITWGKFMESMTYESGVVSGRLLVPYVLQFVKTTPYVFQTYNLFWQIGLVVPTVIFGFILIVIRTIKTRNARLIVFLSFPVIYFLYVGSWHTKFIRYMLPLIPFLSIFASYTLFWIHDRSKRVGEVLIIFLVATSVLWGLAFFSIYTKPQTRIEASRWIYQNIDPGSRILGEHWDDGLPVHLSTTSNRQNYAYSIDQLAIYDEDNTAKATYLARELERADYVIIASRRLYGTLINLPERYPVVSRYYQLLFAGELSYSQAAEFSSYPEIFGFEIIDDASEETFQVYDHPKVIIFRNEHTLSESEIRRKLLLPPGV